MDGDTLQLLDNKVWLNNHQSFLPVKCAGVPSSKVVVTSDDQLIEVASIMLGKGVPSIGSVINIFSQLYTVRGRFSKDSKEYDILTKRLLCGQCISQATIDAKKSGVFFKVPKHWHVLDACAELPDRDFQESLCATQKPFFFIHNYDQLKSDYIEWEDKVNIRTCSHWGMLAKDFLNMDIKDMTEEQVKFYELITRDCPINMNDKSTMKTFTDVVDEELKRISKMGKGKTKETKHLLQYSDVQVDKDTIKAVQKLFNKYASDKRTQVQNVRNTMLFGEDDKFDMTLIIKEIGKNLSDDFKVKVLEACDGDIKVAVNALVEVVYSSKKSATLLWTTFGQEIIEILLERKHHMVNAVVQDENGDIEYKGKKYSMQTVCVK